mmetsp:Transcript_18390/g.51260  ORF Transcript_18390/g.51260 Transcript_18390/m.51260 type:complete len:278 (-) Transcript_18390:440-1273(-)
MYCPPNSPNRALSFVVAHSFGTCPSLVAWFLASCCWTPVERWAMTLRTASAFSSVVASSPSSFMAFRMELPTTTPSAMLATPFTISGEEIPKPTARGRSVALRTRSKNSSRSGGSSVRAPVTPVTETQYKKVVAMSARAAIRLSLLVGATRGTLDRPCLTQALLRAIPSSGGRSTTMNPSAPASLAFSHNRSSPYWIKGLTYPMRMTGTVSPISRAFLTMSRQVSMSDVPFAMATWLAAVMVAPSACGSVYGTPSSMTEAPPSCMAKRMAGVSSFLG